MNYKYNKYDNVNFSNSLLKKFTGETFHKTIPEVDELLANHSKVAVFLFDGSGEYNLNLFKLTTFYIRNHKLLSMDCVNPATTVASTTAFLSGKYPIENGYLGWSLYFDKIGQNVDVFPNKYSKTQEVIPGERVIEQYCPYKNIVELMQEKEVVATSLFPSYIATQKGYGDYKEAGRKASEFFHEEGGQFLYGYFTNPDHDEHQYGVKSSQVRKDMRAMAKFIKRFVHENPDVLVFTMADHGLIDVNYVDISKYPDFMATINRTFSIEGRTPTFYVKDGKEKEFEKLFTQYFGDAFDLYTREEILRDEHFGKGTPHNESLGFIGDYVAVANANKIICDTETYPTCPQFIGHHAGATKEEKTILLAVYNK